METPFGHHHHRRDDDEEEERPRDYYPPPETAPPPPPPPRPFFDDQPPPEVPYSRDDEFEPPPPRPRPTSHYYQEPGYEEPPPPPPPRPYYPETQVIHVSHEEGEEAQIHHHSFRPHLPSFLHHHDQSGSDYLADKPSFKIYCKAEPNFHLTVRDGKVVLAPADPSDAFQKWYKDEKYSTRVKDQDGFPSFSLANKATGQAIKHGVGESQPVELAPYNPNEFSESVLWTQSKDMGDGYRTIRMVNNTHLNMDAFHGDEKSGGVHDGTVIVLWHWNKGNNQLWKIIPHGDM